MTISFPPLPPPAPPPAPPGPVAPPGFDIVDVGTLLAQANAKTLNGTATPVADRQLTVAAVYAMLPIIYGQVRCGALLANAFVYQGNWVFWVLWGQAPQPLNAIVSVTLDDQVLPAGITCTHYGVSSVPAGHTLGTLNAVDPTLTAAFAALGGFPTFAEKCANVAYSVITVPPDKLSGPPTFNAVIQGLKVYDSRLDTTNGGAGAQRLATPSTWTFSRNPALILAHYLVNSEGETLVWSSVATVANANDATVGTGASAEASRLCDIVLDRENSSQQWVETLRTAASCWVVPQGDLTKLVADAAGSSVATYADSSGNILDVTGATLQGTSQLPTVVEVVYTDTTQVPYRDLPALLAKRPGVDAGTTDYRLSTIRMPWITRATQAGREAIERLNKQWLRSMQMGVVLMDEGLKHEPGDLITVTYAELGLTSLQLRVAKVAPNADGWALACMKEDPGVYSTTVLAGPTVPNTTIPLPNNPPAVTGLSVVEDVFQVQTGLFGSRLIVTWTLSTWPHVDSYVVTISQAGVVKDSAVLSRNTTAYTSIQLTENLNYSVNVAIMSSSGTVGPAASASITNNGKLAKPTDVPSITGFEVGGEVRFQWVPATDLDLTAHEIRYSTTAGSWATATLINRVAAPAVAYQTKVVPAGTWRFWIKGLDSVRSTAYPFGQESVNAKFVDITVTTDANAFVAATQTLASPLLFSMVALGGYGSGWVTAMGATWNSLFPTAVNGFTNPLFTYHAAGTSGLVTAIADVGASVSGDWTIGPVYSDLSGTATVSIEVNNPGGEATKTITAATNATPIAVTSVAHGYASNDEVVIAGVVGNTAANGTRLVTVVDADHYTLQDLFGNNIAGNGAYTSGGTSSRWVWQSFAALSVKATARYARARLSTTGTLLVTDLGSVSVNVVARREGATVTTLSSAPTIVTFANKYNKAVAANATPQGTSAFTASCDSIEVSGARGVSSGQALRFNGTSDNVSIPDSVPLQLATSMTLEAQIKFSAITGAVQEIVRKDTEVGTRYFWGLQLNPNGRLQAHYVNVTAYNVFSISPAAVDRWMHCAMVISGTTMTMYLDGVLQGTVTIGGIQGVPTGRMGVGAAPPSTAVPGAFSAWFTGVIDDVRVWNTARTLAQILANMNTPLLGSESGLVGYWKFDSLSGTTATDSTSNANNGTVTGAKWRPLDGMDVYAFNSATGAQVATPVSWLFSGV